MPTTETKAEIKKWYNGFSFDGETRLYNPFSVLMFCQQQTFRNFWFSTGTPTFLLEQIKKHEYLPQNFEESRQFDLSGNTTNINQIPILPLLFQTGYLTIDRVEMVGFQEFYYLNYPNEEVRFSFLSYLSAYFLNKDVTFLQSDVVDLRQIFLAGDWDRFIKKYESYLADIPQRLHIPREAYYHSLTYMLLRMIGFKLILEKETDKGRIDAVLELTDRIYILEFKFAPDKQTKNTTTLAKRAIQQIKNNGYAEAYLGDSRPITLLGIGFINKKIALETEEV